MTVLGPPAMIQAMLRSLARGLRTRLLRRPAWRRAVSRWLEADVRPRLVSERGDAHLAEILQKIAQPLAKSLELLSSGPAALDSPAFASSLYYALAPLTFCPDINVREARLRAYCDIRPTLAVLDLLLPKIASDLGLDELEVARRLAASEGNRREAHVAAGRRLLAAGHSEEAAVYARRALDVMSSCPVSQQLLLDALRERAASGGSLTGVERNALADLGDRFCPRPFEVIVSGQGVGWDERTGTAAQVMGSTYACDCAAWVPFVTGNMLEGESADAVWNSTGMQEVRRSILDGDFTYCSRTLCPSISNATLPRRDDVTAPRLRRIIDNRETSLPDGPRLVALGHDSSCNLACPSCRNELVMANKEESDRLQRGRDRVILPMLRDRRVGVHLTAWGDPFASRHYRSILEALRAPEYDGVRLFLLTNGLGLTPQTWAAMPHLAGKIVELRVSVDAATKATYEDVRRPGRWETLRENLDTIGALHRAGTFARNREVDGESLFGSDLEADGRRPASFAIAFVVQSANFREMPDFVRLAEELGAEATFQKYYSFGHESPAAFSSKDVTSPAHPDHEHLQEILRHPALQGGPVLPLFLAQLGTRTA